jgi:hypothetical protein
MMSAEIASALLSRGYFLKRSLVAGVVLMFAMLSWADQADNQRPQFLQSNEEVYKVVRNYVYLVGRLSDRPLRTERCSAIYFASTLTGNVVRRDLILPEGAGRTFVIADTDKYIALWQFYPVLIDGKDKAKVILFNNEGKRIIAKNVSASRGTWNAIIDNARGLLLLLRAGEGALEVWSSKGRVLKQWHYSSFGSPPPPQGSDQGEAVEDTADVLGEVVRASDDGSIIALARSSPSSPTYDFGEITLLASDGRRLFQHQVKGMHAYPKEIDKTRQLVVFGFFPLDDRLNMKPNSTYYIGYNFNGKKLWTKTEEEYAK